MLNMRKIMKFESGTKTFTNKRFYVVFGLTLDDSFNTE